jgi:DNA-binding NarL/FixJ family response regulator
MDCHNPQGGPFPAMPDSVLIVEDDPEFRSAYAKAVQSAADLHLIGAADDLPDGLRLLEQTKPDVLLVDIGLPSGSGVDLIRYAKAHVPHCESMVVTIFADDQLVIRCVEAGATGYLLKGTSGMDIVQQIRLLRDGGSPISPAIARRLLKRFELTPDARAVRDESSVTLSKQELCVLSMSTKGYNYDEIAVLMRVSRHTVGTYVKRIYRKFQVHSKTEAIYEARRQGLMDD